MSTMGIIVLCFILLALAIITYHILHSTQDSREPVILRSTVPFVGHLLGLFTHGVDYFRILRDSKWLSIYSLDILSARIYVVNCPKLASAIQRCDMTLSFYPIIHAVSGRLLKLHKEDMEKMELSERDGVGHSHFMKDLKDIHHRVLGPGLSLNRIRNATLESIAEYLNLTSVNSSESIYLYAWGRHIHTISTVSAIWGPTLSFDNEPKLEEALWTVEKELAMLMLDLFPKFTAPSAHRARSKLQDAFLKYYRTNGKGNATAPDFVQRKKALAQKYNLSDHYNSRADVGELLAMLANVVPVSFWVLFYVFSSPSLLADLRTEVQNHLLQRDLDEDADGIKSERGYLDVPHIQTKCPLLVSTWKEVLRIATLTTTTNRCVLADTYIGSQILLKKGGIVQIPTGAFHSDHNIWGSNVNEFDPRRFLPSKQAHRSAAFRPFGGGSTMCPGRYLAVTEILGFVSAVILGFEISPAVGEWKLPEKDSRPFPGTVKPASDIKVVIRRRVGFEKTIWSFKRFDV